MTGCEGGGGEMEWGALVGWPLSVLQAMPVPEAVTAEHAQGEEGAVSTSGVVALLALRWPTRSWREALDSAAVHAQARLSMHPDAPPLGPARPHAS